VCNRGLGHDPVAGKGKRDAKGERKHILCVIRAMPRRSSSYWRGSFIPLGCAMSIHVGCGSWADPEYTGILHQPGVKGLDRLGSYAAAFDFVEVNSSYYATPRAETVAAWVKQTPAGFIFDVKLHRAFSQSPAKAAAGELPGYLLKGVQPLIKARRLGVFLLVLPPTFSPPRHDLGELDLLVEKLSPHRLAVELRHSDWIEGTQRKDTLAYFRKRELVWVAVDMPRIKGSDIMPPIDEVTNSEVGYLRLHGRNKNWLEAKSAAARHEYDYGKRELTELAARAQQLAENAKDVHVVANNHAQDFAPKAALALKALLK
jgi:uncharacterized protein YecE (DUF72 family)